MDYEGLGREAAVGAGSLPTLLVSRPRTPLAAADAAAAASRKAPQTEKERAAETRRRGRMAPAPLVELLGEEEEDTPLHSVRVKNTFLEGAARRSPSLEAFYRERAIQTCPSDKVGLLNGLRQEFDGTMDWESEAAQPTLPSPCCLQTPCSMTSPSGSGLCFPGLLGEVAPGELASVGDYLAWECSAAYYYADASFSGVYGAAEVAPPVAAVTAFDFPGMASAPVYGAETATGLVAEVAPPSAPSAFSLEPAYMGQQQQHQHQEQQHLLALQQQEQQLLLQQQQQQQRPSDQPRAVLNLAEALGGLPGAYATDSNPCGGLCAAPLPAPSGGALVSVAAEGGAAGAMLARCLESLPQYPAPKLDDSSAAKQLGLIATVPVSEPPPPPPSGPALGSEGLPSSGSAAHAIGGCRPCAFLHMRGCENGLSCPFCHLCGPEEKRRRRKEKLDMKRAALKTGRVLDIQTAEHQGGEGLVGGPSAAPAAATATAAAGGRRGGRCASGGGGGSRRS